MRQWPGQARLPDWASGRPQLAGQARPGVAGLLAGCAVLVVVLGALFAGQRTADPFDQAVGAPVVTWFARHPVLALRLAYPATPSRSGPRSAMRGPCLNVGAGTGSYEPVTEGMAVTTCPRYGRVG